MNGRGQRVKNNQTNMMKFVESEDVEQERKNCEESNVKSFKRVRED